MKWCSNCHDTHVPLKRYMWNTYTNKLNIKESYVGLLCDDCAKRKGAWQTQGQLSLTDEDIERLEREEKYSSLN